MFYDSQNEKLKNEYEELLKVVGSLSNLFSESPIPYLYYRAAENIFCRAFNAENLSRGDVSADATKENLGIGLKTFLHNNGNTFQKIAEFNRGAFDYQSMSSKDIVQVISKQRNERISFTKRAHDLDNMIYHIVTREKNGFNIYEEPMDKIDVFSIREIKRKKNVIHFKDNIHTYSFNLSKSTLFKRFVTEKPIYHFDVDILEDPYSYLLEKATATANIVEAESNSYEHVYLPLYSPESGEVQKGSGLNQWNAGGRARNSDELYLPIPIWVHKVFEGFFPYDLEAYQESRKNKTKYKAPNFTLQLPNGSEISSKICQENGKALMSNPNKLLGHWMLREVLQIPEGQLVTYDMLEKIGIDSVIVTKFAKDYFRIDFSKIASYTNFEEEFKP